MSGRVLLTGGTGMVGSSIAQALVAADDRCGRWCGRARAVSGSCRPRSSSSRATSRTRRRCAAPSTAARSSTTPPDSPSSGSPTPAIFERVNVRGTANDDRRGAGRARRALRLLEHDRHFRRRPGAEYDETVIDPQPKGTYYERSKQDADRLVVAGARPRPAGGVRASVGGLRSGAGRLAGNERLHRPDPARRDPDAAAGGMPVVYAPDLAAGHLLAETKAAVGARYILSESYLRWWSIARAVVAAAGRGKVPRVMPMGVRPRRVAHRRGDLQRDPEAAADPGRPAPLPRSGRRAPSSARAQRELGWTPTPFARRAARDDRVRIVAFAEPARDRVSGSSERGSPDPLGARSAPGRGEMWLRSARTVTESTTPVWIARGCRRWPRTRRRRAPARFAHRAGRDARAPAIPISAGSDRRRSTDRRSAGLRARSACGARRGAVSVAAQSANSHRVDYAGVDRARPSSLASDTSAPRSGALRAPSG